MDELQRCTGCSQVHGARMEKKGTHCTGAISLLKVHCLSCELTLSASCSPPALDPIQAFPVTLSPSSSAPYSFAGPGHICHLGWMC